MNFLFFFWLVPSPFVLGPLTGANTHPRRGGSGTFGNQKKFRWYRENPPLEGTRYPKPPPSSPTLKKTTGLCYALIIYLFIQRWRDDVCQKCNVSQETGEQGSRGMEKTVFESLQNESKDGFQATYLEDPIAQLSRIMHIHPPVDCESSGRLHNSMCQFMCFQPHKIIWGGENVSHPLQIRPNLYAILQPCK